MSTKKGFEEGKNKCTHRYPDGRWAIVMHFGTVGVCALCGMIFN